MKDNIPFTFSFIPYYYGPYSEDLSETVDSLCGTQAIKEERKELPSGIYQYNYTIDEKGKNMLENHINELGEIRRNFDTTIEELREFITPDLVTLSKELLSREVI